MQPDHRPPLTPRHVAAVMDLEGISDEHRSAYDTATTDTERAAVARLALDAAVARVITAPAAQNRPPYS